MSSALNRLRRQDRSRSADDRSAGGYTPPRPDDRPPSAPPPARAAAADAPGGSEADRVRQRLAERAAQIRGGHWQMRRCGRGHPFELHRTSAGVVDPGWRCPICGDVAAVEEPEETARREYAAASTPVARARALFDAVSDWAQLHLNAASWTQQSDAARAARARSTDTERGGKNPFDL